MKNLPLLTFLLLNMIAYLSSAQNKLSPVEGLLAKLPVVSEEYNAIWYVWTDTVKKELAVVSTIIQAPYHGNQVLVIQKIAIKGSSTRWVDTTVAMKKTMAPVYHSSFNGQREMVVRFAGRKVEGYYKNLRDGTVSNIRDTTEALYFDSNIYPQLIRFLPLKIGYTASIPIYDFNLQKHGILHAHITDVEEVDVPDKSGIVVTCYAVKIKDEISPEAESVHYISKNDRKVIKSELVMGNRKMSIEQCK